MCVCRQATADEVDTRAEPNRGFVEVLVTPYSLLQLAQKRSPRLPRLPNDLRTVAASMDREVRATRKMKQ